MITFLVLSDMRMMSVLRVFVAVILGEHYLPAQVCHQVPILSHVGKVETLMVFLSIICYFLDQAPCFIISTAMLVLSSSTAVLTFPRTCKWCLFFPGPWCNDGLWSILFLLFPFFLIPPGLHGATEILWQSLCGSNGKETWPTCPSLLTPSQRLTPDGVLGLFAKCLTKLMALRALRF